MSNRHSFSPRRNGAMSDIGFILINVVGGWGLELSALRASCPATDG
jgi:hypothetical protein